MSSGCTRHMLSITLRLSLDSPALYERVAPKSLALIHCALPFRVCAQWPMVRLWSSFLCKPWPDIPTCASSCPRLRTRTGMCTAARCTCWPSGTPSPPCAWLPLSCKRSFSRRQKQPPVILVALSCTTATSPSMMSAGAGDGSVSPRICVESDTNIQHRIFKTINNHSERFRLRAVDGLSSERGSRALADESL
jgi:hypothetical protein